VLRRLPTLPPARVHYTPLQYDGADILLRATNRLERRRRRAARIEPWTVEWIERTIGPGEILWDVGANVGAFSLIAATRPTRPRVVAIEPAFPNFGALCANLVKNGITDEVLAVPLPLAAETGVTQMALGDLEAGYGLSTLAGVEEAPKAAWVQHSLGVKLDDLVDVFGLPHPNHLKIDVEGAAPMVLAGAEEILSSGALRSVMIEIDPDAEDGILPAFEQAGLDLVQRFRRRKAGKLVRVSYGLFARPGAGVEPLAESARFAV